MYTIMNDNDSPKKGTLTKGPNSCRKPHRQQSTPKRWPVNNSGGPYHHQQATKHEQEYEISSPPAKKALF
jgi:hypothetical protein